jgi:hypothetical protein
MQPAQRGERPRRVCKALWVELGAHLHSRSCYRIQQRHVHHLHGGACPREVAQLLGPKLSYSGERTRE